MTAKQIRINEMRQNVGEMVELRGWLYNARASGKVQFLMVRDGSGLCQAVFEKTDTNEELFAEVKHLGQESSVMVTGTVRDEPRSVGGYELAADDVKIVHNTQDYPITPQTPRHRIPDEAPPPAPALAAAVGPGETASHDHRRHTHVL